MTKTERGKYTFTVKETAGGRPWICLEPSGGGVNFPGDGSLGFDLPGGTDIEKAKEIARYLNNNLRELSFTSSK